MKRIILSLLVMGTLFSGNLFAKEGNIKDWSKPARSLSECEKAYKYYAYNGHDKDGYFNKNKKLMSCVDLKHTQSMCSVAMVMYDGKNGFEKNRRKAYKMAKESMSIAKRTGSSAALCRQLLLFWKF